jgi:CTP synthase (UTP-ammonia lyase)
VKAVVVLAEFSRSFEPHVATNDAIKHSRQALNLDVATQWIGTEEIEANHLSRAAGLWIAPGSPYCNLPKTLWAIQYAREQGVPCLGTCGGFQHMVLEYARNVLGFMDAQHAEYDPYASRLFISRLACSLVGREMELELAPGSKIARIYGSTSARERYYCNFGVSPEGSQFLRGGPLRVTGRDLEGEARVIELPDHPFFMGTLYVPQARSEPDQPHPLVDAFLRAVAA